MRKVKQSNLWTVEELKQHLRKEHSGARKFNERVRLAKNLLAAADKSDLENLVVDEYPMPWAYEEPPAEALTVVGPGYKVSVCHWTYTNSCDDPGGVCFPNVLVTHRSGDEFRGYISGGFFNDDDQRICFELKHICYIEDDGTGTA